MINPKEVTLRLSLACCLLASLFAPQVVAQSNSVPTAPKGWKKSTIGKKVVFSKRSLGDGEHLSVNFYERELLVDKSLEQWLQSNLVERRAPMRGKWKGPIKSLNRLTRNVYSAEREFESDGVDHVLSLTAVCVDKLNVRMAAAVVSRTKAAQRFRLEANRIQAELLKLEIESAKKDKRGLSIEKNPPKVKGLTYGQRILPGLYVGTSVAKRDGKAGTRFDLIVHENGDFEFLNKKRNATGKYVYSMANGRLEIDDPFENDSRDWDEYCVYGKSRKGDYVIHAESNYWKTRLKWVKKSDRPSPTQLKREEEIAKAEAGRYKHVTEPGQGIRPEEIEKVMYCWDMAFRSGAAKLDFEGFLLLKDGRVHDGLPCAPDVMDLPASLSREPDAWGWWKETENDKKGRYKFAWPVRPREYRMPKGKQAIGVPFKKGARLAGDFGAASTSVNLASGYSSVRWWGIKLNKNGRFLKYRHGSTQAGGVPGMETLVTSVWDDEGSVTAISGPEVVGGNKTKFNNPALDKMGKYEFDGYRLTLKFDSGRIEHQATFTDEKLGIVWFEGRALHRKEDKKKK